MGIAHVYYRIVSVDVSGQKQYSRTKTLFFTNSPSLTSYPVPFDQELKLMLQTFNSDDMIIVYNSLGAVKVKISSFGAIDLIIPTGNWTAGVYFVEYISRQGTFIYKIVK